VGGYIFFTRDQVTKPETTTPELKKVITLTAPEVQTITIKPNIGKTIEFTRDGMDWKITKPITGPAESGLVQAMVNDLTDLQSQAQVDISEGTGLKTPRFVVDLTTKDGKTTTINIGDKSAVGDQLYVQLQGNAKADMVTAGVEEQIDKPLDDFRQKKLVTLGTPQIKYVSIDRPEGKLVLEKTGEDWNITSPEKMKADSSAVSDLLFGITGLSADEFIDGSATSPVYGLHDHAKTITIAEAVPSTTQPTTQPAPVTIRVGLADILDKNNYATVEGSNVLVKVSKTSLSFLDKKAIEFRDKDVLDVQPKSVSKLTVTTDRPATTQPTTLPAEKKTVVAMRRSPAKPATRPSSQPATQSTSQPTTQTAATKPAAEPELSAWIAGTPAGGPANDADIDGILAALHPLKAEKFLDEADVPKTGTTITVTLETGGGVWAAGKTELTILDPGGAKSPVATYNGLHFEIERSLLDKLEADFTKPAAPHTAEPHAPSPMGPVMMH
jgi:hypothetical protein